MKQYAITTIRLSWNLISKFIIVNCIFWANYSFSFSAEIAGKILDATTRKSLANANIVIKGTQIGTISSSNGSFSINVNSTGEVSILVTMMGYKSLTKTIVIGQAKEMLVNFELQPTVLELSSITVTGERNLDRAETPQKESPALETAMSTITQREIVRQGAKTLVDALKYIPSALIETRGRKVKQFVSFRGQRYPYPDYAINGAWQREFHETPYFFSSNDIERIEVIRSSSAFLMGLNGLAGIINIFTKQYEQPETTGEVEYGSFGYFRSHISHGSRIGKTAYASGIGFRHTNGPSHRHASEGFANFYGSIIWDPNEKLNLRLDLFHLDGKQELALAEPPAAYRYQTELLSYNPLKMTFANLKMHFQPKAKMSTEAMVYFTHRDPILIDENYSSHAITRTREKDYEGGLSLIQSLTLSSQNMLRFGGIVNRWIAPNGKRFYTGRQCDLTTYSLVLVNDFCFNQMSLNGGLRWQKTYIHDYGAFNIDGSAQGFAKVAPIENEWEPSIYQGCIGLVYYFANNFSLHFNSSAGEITPRRGTLDVSLSEIENELRLKFDLGLRKVWLDFGQIALTGFLVNQKNAIELSGSTYDLDGRTMELYMNRDQNQFGLEGESKLTDLFNIADVFLNLTMMSSRLEKNGKMEENKELPRLICNGGLYGQYLHFDLAILGQYVSSFESTRFAEGSKTNPPLPQPLGDFFAVDLTLGWNLKSRTNTRFYLEIQNLTDEKYSTVVGYPDFGRKFTVGVRQKY